MQVYTLDFDSTNVWFGARDRSIANMRRTQAPNTPLKLTFNLNNNNNNDDE